MQENDFATPALSDDAAATTVTETSENTATDNTVAEDAVENPDEDEEITYHAVQKDNNVTAIWEMQGRKHLRTIDPRSREGQEILRLFTDEEGEDSFEQAA